MMIWASVFSIKFITYIQMNTNASDVKNFILPTIHVGWLIGRMQSINYNIWYMLVGQLTIDYMAIYW